jgi:hypothetical protein
MANQEQKQALWDACEKFIQENQISCPESIYQRDSMWEKSPEFVESVCEIVGYSTDGQ